MRTQLICAALTLCGTAATGFSENKPAVPVAARDHEHDRDHDRTRVGPEKTLGSYYGANYQCQINTEYEVNGVKCYSAIVHGATGDAAADFTAYGDLMTMGVPEAFNTLPPGAAETVQLFNNPPVSVIREDLHAFWVTIKGGVANRPYVVEFDATGRIRDIKNPEQLRHDDSNPQKVGGPLGRKIADVAAQRFADEHVQEVWVATAEPGYYMIPFRNKIGQGWAITNENNDVIEWRSAMRFDDLPEAVREGLRRELHGDRVLNVQYGAKKMYRITQTIKGEQLQMVITPNGAVDWLSSHALHPHRDEKR